ncbi:D-cysteine desulfhydrase family protein [Caballeronia sp. GACF5]|uniref:D-cysteine desulfhydrase family protein n=1 Tax=Caballeronia sp. GACF5 TaxID=2921746 RepID=UPI002028E309|nr:D-cysteine desulfhydrase family protein [Caballeronia sp. GACF5]
MSKNMNSFGRNRIGLAQTPTPLERLERLSDRLGIEILIKRDDLTGLAGGGNKVRKLEFLMADALAQGADTVVTAGALQSNHARQTAAAAAKLGLRCVLVLAEAVQGRSQAYASGGNLALDRLLGAEIRRVRFGEDVATVVSETLANLETDGRRPYSIPVGGSNLIGAMGYALAAHEIEEQAKAMNVVPNLLVTGSGSAGTQAGLVLGTALPILGISVSAKEADLVANVKRIVDEGAKLPHFEGADSRRIWVDDRFIGDGYGQPTEAMLSALRLVARLEAIFLDPVYSGKAMAGLIRMASEKRIMGPVIFLHTGGMPAIFAYDDVL